MPNGRNSKSRSRSNKGLAARSPRSRRLLGALVGRRRFAFVIGNANYADSIALPKARSDAEGMIEALEGLRFSVTPLFDGTSGRGGPSSDIRKRFSAFVRSLRHADAVVLYYSGHGMQIDDTSYIVPIDTRSADKESVIDDPIPISYFIDLLTPRRARCLIVILDACRDNPMVEKARQLGVERVVDRVAKAVKFQPGLAAVNQPTDFLVPTYIAFAAAPGRVAYSGDAEDIPRSIFTYFLLKYIGTADQSLDTIMQRTRQDVANYTDRRQEPWVHYSLDKPFFFYPAPAIWLTVNLVPLLAFLVAVALPYLFAADVAAFFAAEPGAFAEQVFSENTVLSISPVLLSGILLFLTAEALIYKLQTTTRFLRGLRPDVGLTWRDGLLGGFFGGIFVGVIVASSYIFLLDWRNSFRTVGDVYVQIVVAAGISGAVLGLITTEALGLWRRWRVNRRSAGATVKSALADIAVGAAGGLIAGLLLGPLMTVYFAGFEARPSIDSPRFWAILVGGIIGCMLIAFSILNASLHGLTGRRLARDLLASGAAALAVGGALVPVGLALGDDVTSFFEGPISGWLGAPSVELRLLAGIVIGGLAGPILGAVIALAPHIAEAFRRPGPAIVPRAAERR